MTQEKHGFRIEVTKENPKKDAPKYKINNLQDIADCVTNENINRFLECFEGILLIQIATRELTNSFIAKGEIPKDSKLLFTSFEWTDD